LSHKAGQHLTRAYTIDQDGKRPDWLGRADFHAAHRAVLLAKDPEWYGQFGWPESPAEKVNGRWPYVWPV